MTDPVRVTARAGQIKVLSVSANPRVTVRAPAPAAPRVTVNSILRVVEAGGGGGGSGAREVYVQPAQPTGPGPYIWVQTGLPPAGEGFTIWFEDGA